MTPREIIVNGRGSRVTSIEIVEREEEIVEEIEPEAEPESEQEPEPEEGDSEEPSEDAMAPDKFEMEEPEIEED